VYSGPPELVWGSVHGLVGQGLTLELVRKTSGTSFVVEAIEISRNGNFTFQTPVTYGSHSAYYVVIQLQPHSPTQRCVQRVGIAFAAEIECGEFAYVTSAADNTISAFSIDATTGALASVGPSVPAGMSPSAIVGRPDKVILYVSNGGSNDVSQFAVAAGTGKLTTEPGSPLPAGTNPRAMSVSDDYCYLFVANYGSDTVSVLGTGVPTPTYATGTGPSAMAMHPSNSFLYTANAGGDVSAFRIIGLTLTPIPGSPFPSGSSSVRSLAFGAGGKFLYGASAGEDTASVIGFSVDPDAGALASVPGLPLPYCNYIVADQTGAYLYATAGTDLFGYSIDAQSGALNLLSGFPVAVGASADSVIIDPTNQFLYVRNGSAGTVTGFELNGATGGVTPMPGSPFAVRKSADFIATL
jgi:6-phosphogluconolactonase